MSEPACYAFRLGNELAEQHTHAKDEPCPQRARLDGIRDLLAAANQTRADAIVERTKALPRDEHGPFKLNERIYWLKYDAEETRLLLGGKLSQAERRAEQAEADAAAMRERLIDLDRFLRNYHQRDHAQIHDSKVHCEEIARALSGDAGRALLAERDALRAKVEQAEREGK